MTNYKNKHRRGIISHYYSLLKLIIKDYVEGKIGRPKMEYISSKRIKEVFGVVTNQLKVLRLEEEK